MSVDEPRPGSGAQGHAPAAVARRRVPPPPQGGVGAPRPPTRPPFPFFLLVPNPTPGAPIFLISRLALHTRNLDRDARASLLIEPAGGLGDPLTGDRLTLVGEARKSTSPTALRRFLGRHPSAERYAGFADFSMYALQIA